MKLQKKNGRITYPRKNSVRPTLISFQKSKVNLKTEFKTKEAKMIKKRPNASK